MKNIEVLKVYNLVDSKGNKLRLNLGMAKNPNDASRINDSDLGYRWRFIGKHIPMPVRSGYWFNGFAENIMLDWLKGNDWAVQSKVYMPSGYTEVYELPKGNEEDICIQPIRHELDEKYFCEIICDLVNNGKTIRAVHLYRYANGGDVLDARKAVMEICSRA